MTPEISLHNKLSEATRRIRLILVFRWTSRALCWTALACLVWLLAARLSGRGAPDPAAIILILGFAGLIGAGIGASRRLTTMDVALLTDRRMETKDRLASAVEFEREAATDPLLRQQIHDAGAHAAALDMRAAYPLRFSREAGGFIALALAIAAVFWLPTLPAFWTAQKREEAKEIQREAAAFEKVARDTQKAADAQKLEESKKAARETERLAEAMKKGGESKKTAMVKLAKLTRAVEEQHKRAAQANGPATKSLEQAAKEVREALERRQQAVSAAIREDQKRQDAKGADSQKARPKESARDKEGSGNRDRKGEKSGAGSKAQAQQKRAEGRKPGENQQMSEAMKEAQRALQKFSQALTDQDGAKQNEALQKLAEQMEKGGMSQNEMKQLQQQLQELAKALKGSELDKAAQQMQQMAEMMKDLKLDPETMKKLAEAARQAGGT